MHSGNQTIFYSSLKYFQNYMELDATTEILGSIYILMSLLMKNFTR